MNNILGNCDEIRFLNNYSEILYMRDAIKIEYIVNEKDGDFWYDAKHEYIDEVCTKIPLDDVKQIVNDNYCVLEIIEAIVDEYGHEYMKDFLNKNNEMKYRELLYHILNEYLEIYKNKWDDEDDEDDEEDDDVDDDTATEKQE